MSNAAFRTIRAWTTMGRRIRTACSRRSAAKAGVEMSPSRDQPDDGIQAETDSRSGDPEGAVEENRPPPERVERDRIDRERVRSQPHSAA